MGAYQTHQTLKLLSAQNRLSHLKVILLFAATLI